MIVEENFMQNIFSKSKKKKRPLQKFWKRILKGLDFRNISLFPTIYGIILVLCFNKNKFNKVRIGYTFRVGVLYGLLKLGFSIDIQY